MSELYDVLLTNGEVKTLYAGSRSQALDTFSRYLERHKRMGFYPFDTYIETVKKHVWETSEKVDGNEYVLPHDRLGQ